VHRATVACGKPLKWNSGLTQRNETSQSSDRNGMWQTRNRQTDEQTDEIIWQLAAEKSNSLAGYVMLVGLLWACWFI